MDNLQKFTIAHIDDDPMILDMTKLILEQNEHFEISSYSTAEDFLSAIELKGKPHLVIVDYFLNSKIPSAMSGSKLIQIFRSQRDQIPVIVISSQKKLSVALKLIKLQVVDYIEKTDDFSSRIVDSVNDVIKMQKICFKKNQIARVIRKDQEHLLRLALILFSGLAITYLLGMVFL